MLRNSASFNYIVFYGKEASFDLRTTRIMSGTLQHNPFVSPESRAIPDK
jgi:hypothetical protein